MYIKNQWNNRIYKCGKLKMSKTIGCKNNELAIVNQDCDILGIYKNERECLKILDDIFELISEGKKAFEMPKYNNSKSLYAERYKIGTKVKCNNGDMYIVESIGGEIKWRNVYMDTETCLKEEDVVFI